MIDSDPKKQKANEEIAKLKKITLQLAAKSEQYQKIFDSSPNLIIYKSKEDKIIDCNKAFIEFQGVSKEKLIGKSTFDVVTPKAVAQKVRADDLTVIRTGKSRIRIEAKFVSPFSKQEFIGLYSKYPYYYKQNNHNHPNTNHKRECNGTLTFVTDITKLKKSENKIKESEAQLSLITDNIPVLISYVNAQERYQFVNKMYTEWFGQTQKDIQGRRIREILGAKAYQQIRQQVRQALSGKKVIFEADIPYKHAGLSFVHAEYVPHLDEKRKVLGFFSLIQDISERKKLENKLKENEERLKLITSSIPEGMDIVDEKCNILWMSDKFLKIFGAKSIGKKCYQVYKDNHKQCENCPLRKPIKIGDSKILTVSGVAGEKTFDITHTGMIYGEKKAILEVFHDVTDQKKAEDVLKKSKEDVERQVEERTRELKEAKDKYALLYQSSQDAIMTLEPPSWRFTSGNPATVKMFNCKDEKEFISLGPWQLSPKYQPDGQLSSLKAKEMIGKAMKEGKNFFEWTHKRLNGDDFPATVLLSRIRNGKTFLQATVRDISSEKEAENKLLETKVELVKKVDDLERFNKITVGRELKMIELKKQIESMRKKIEGLEKKQ